MTDSVDVMSAAVTATGCEHRLDSLDHLESALADVLYELLDGDRVTATSHFFNDLGADSMVMARFCARIRKRPDMPSVSMRDVYEHPTIAALVSAVVKPTVTAPDRSAVESLQVVSEPQASGGPAPSTTRYVFCGLGQLVAFLGYSYLVTVTIVRGFQYVVGGFAGFLAGNDLVHWYARSACVGLVGFIGLSVLPIFAKWILVGRWKPRRIRLWGLAYLRFWIVKTALRYSPLILFTGTPLYNLYLRALGVKVGRRVLILSRNIPVCTDLLTIGDDTVIREVAFFQCYRAEPGWLELGRVSIGSAAFVGTRSVLDINTSIGDNAQLGHVSSLHSGQQVPAGQRWHGSPAQPTLVRYLRVEPVRCGTPRRIIFCLITVLAVLALYVPLFLMGAAWLFVAVPPLARLVAAPGAAAVGQVATNALVFSGVLFGCSVIAGLFGALTIPRLANMLLTPDRVYPLYGLRYRALRLIRRTTNIRFFTYLFGDSSFIVYYLRCLGYDLSRIVQTGSNFGIEVTQVNPYASFVGSGTMIADGLSIMNADFSSSSFRVSGVSIGARNFLGNDIVYPPGGRTGDNCLLATKVMVPLDGDVRHDVGLLGSPAFEIPRSVERDSQFDDLREGAELRKRLVAKNFYNARSMAVYVFVRWLHVFVLSWLGLLAVNHYVAFGHLVATAYLVLLVAVSALYIVGVERAFTAWRPLQPRFCSIYDPHFWWHERLWKTPAVQYFAAFNGTPFKNILWRMMGVRLGARVFDDGCFVTERTLVRIGDDCALNAGSKIQCHSQEDGTFKSDHSTIGSACTVGVGALVHYGVTMNDRATLSVDAFLMKGEDVPAGAHWGGNPARDVGHPAPAALGDPGQDGDRHDA